MQSLRQLVQSENNRLHLAIALGAAASLLMIWQCWLLATLCDLALHQQQIPPDLLLHILLLWLLRPVLLAAKDLLGLSASQKLRTSLRHQLLGIISQAGPLRQQIASDGDLSTRLLEQVDALEVMGVNSVKQKKEMFGSIRKKHRPMNFTSFGLIQVI